MNETVHQVNEVGRAAREVYDHTALLSEPLLLMRDTTEPARVMALLTGAMAMAIDAMTEGLNEPALSQSRRDAMNTVERGLSAMLLAVAQS